MEYRVRAVHRRSGLQAQREQVFYTQQRAEGYAKRTSKSLGDGHRLDVLAFRPGRPQPVTRKSYVSGRVLTT